jgi:hypothetical protein
MAFVSQYQYDIFVSYAHVDDSSLPGAEIGWVTNLVNCIKTRLAQKLGRSDAYALWMDHELSGHVPVSSQIIDTLSRTATLVVVLSPGYVASDWCLREKSAFLGALRELRRLGVFVVEREPVDENERPVEFKELRGYQFWVQNRDDKRPRILGSPRPDPSDREYYLQVDDLCSELVDELKRMRIAGTQAASLLPAPGQPGSSQPTVFLAQVTDDLETQRNNIKRFLSQLEVGVLPATLYSSDPANFRISVGRDLAKCGLFVQLLSEIAGKKPPDLPQGYAALQLDLARAAKKPILQWRRPNLDFSSVDDPDQVLLLDGETVRAEGIEEFKAEIRRRLFTAPATTPSRPLNTFVFVNMETSDRPLAERVCSMLDGYGAGYSLPSRTADPGENRRDMEQNLLNCDAAIVVYGSAAANWVRSQLLEFRKIIAKRERPLKTLAVFEAPPEEKDSIDLKLPNMQVWNFRKGVDETELAHFLDKVAVEAA